MRSLERGDSLTSNKGKLFVRGFESDGTPIAGELTLDELKQASVVVRGLHAIVGVRGNLTHLQELGSDYTEEEFLAVLDEHRDFVRANLNRRIEELGIPNTVLNPVVANLESGIEAYLENLENDPPSKDCFQDSMIPPSQEDNGYVRRCPFEGYARSWDRVVREAMGVESIVSDMPLDKASET